MAAHPCPAVPGGASAVPGEKVQGQVMPGAPRAATFASGTQHTSLWFRFPAPARFVPGAVTVENFPVRVQGTA